MLEFLKSFILTPLSLLWDFIYRFRRYLYNYGYIHSESYALPVISVGNITFGGTGKTPFTIWLTKQLSKRSLAPVVLTRGYKGKLEHKHGIIEAKKSFKYNPVDFGDEPLLIARRLKKGAVIVGKKRYLNFNHYFDHVKPDVAILDDGFQHLKINRNLNIVLFDALLPSSQYNVAPKGYLREGMTSLKDADAIVISRSNQVHEQVLQALEEKICQFTRADVIWSHIYYRPLGIFNANYEKVYDLDELKGRKVFACAAVANPNSFFKQLEELGMVVIDRAVFPDHYFFTLDDVLNFMKRAEENDAIIITSEKDIVKIRKISSEIEVYYMEIEVAFKKGEEDFKSLMKKKLRPI